MRREDSGGHVGAAPLRAWGVVRAAVVAVGVLLAAAFWMIDPADPAGDRAFWGAVTLIAGAAGLISSSRVRVLSPERVIARERRTVAPADAARSRTTPPGASWADTAAVLVPRVLGDAVALVLVATAGMALRVGIHVAEAGWSAPSLRLLITTPIATFIVFAAAVVVGGLLVVAVGGLVQLTRMPRVEVPPSARWLFGAVAAIAVASPATLVVGLTDTTPVAADGTAAIVAFLVGPVVLAEPWQVAVLWLARLALAVFAVCVVGLVAARAAARRRG